MAHYTGFVSIPHGSYQEWRDATLGNSYDYDGWWYAQCWDFVQELYAQYNLILQTGDGTAAGCWILMQNANAVYPFIAVTGVQNIKRGDIIVMGRTSYNYAGHICFADEDYNGTNRINCLGQNQTGTGGGSPASVNNLGLDQFLGVFRNTLWQGDVPPEPESSYNKHRYNFVLFNRRKRQEKWTRKPLNQRSKNSVL